MVKLMSKIEQKLTIPVKPGTVMERIETAINDKKKDRQASEAMKKWLTMGFLVGEMGNGILELFLTLEECGQLAGKTPHETAMALVSMIQSRTTEDRGGLSVGSSQPPATLDSDIGFADVPQSQTVTSYD